MNIEQLLANYLKSSTTMVVDFGLENRTSHQSSKKLNLHELKSKYKVPLICPTCSTPMKSQHDPVFYRIHGTCMNCEISRREELKRKGKDTINEMIVDTYLDGYIKYVDELVENYDNLSTVGELGDVEVVDGATKLTKKQFRDRMMDEYHKFRKSLLSS